MRLTKTSLLAKLYFCHYRSFYYIPKFLAEIWFYFFVFCRGGVYPLPQHGRPQGSPLRFYFCGRWVGWVKRKRTRQRDVGAASLDPTCLLRTENKALTF